MTVSDLLEQPCSKSDNINKLVPNLLTTWDRQAVRTQLVDDLSADLLQDARFFRVYTRKNLTSCSKSANKPSTMYALLVDPKLSTSLEQAVNNL
jgi:hypothetical protein